MEAILGIDLGTTNSAVAVLRDGEVTVLREEGETLMPSVVGLDGDGRLLVGAAARNQWVLAPDRTVRSIKRRMGEEATVRLGNQQYTPQEISAFILRSLKDRAERHFGHPVRKAVITVPAFFNENQREATHEAGELAGLEVVRIINEPTAASLSYESRAEKMERLLVYDLGGGTFDVSVVQIEAGVVEVLSSHGDTHLGGDDFDQLLLDWVCDDFAKEHGVDLRESLVAKSRVLRAVEEAKIALSFQAIATIEEEFIAEKRGVPLHWKREIERHEYEELIGPLLDRTLTCVDESLTDANLRVNQIDKVILVGGASRTPLVHRLLREQLAREVHSEVDPDLCVTMGAAIQGGLIAGIDVGPILVDITPHTLGIGTLGPLQGFLSPNHFSPVIERNTSLPASRSEIFGTTYDGQDAARIHVFQGEDEDVRHNDPVGEFRLEGLAEVQRGNEILVRFDLDLDGILKVTATERATGLEKQLVVDNAVSRFRAKNREEALARVAAAFESSTSAPPAPRDADTDLSPELKQTIGSCEELISKAERIRPGVNPEDAAEMRELAGQLRTAILERSQAEMEELLPKLEDLVFYLEDV
ncbi:MAG: Hsp70 family protein [Planctomycetota bacterium]